ncbi:g11405 [Coccomyxa elongata]
MKRQLPDPQGGGPVKRSVRPGQPSTSGKLTTNDALSYLRDVKVKFQDNKEIYDEFLEIMKEFKAQRINTEGVIRRVKTLFKGHKELILGFNTFLPQGYEITVDEVDEEERAQAPKAAVEFDQAINYVNKIKTRFATDERVYKAFLEILNLYRKGQKTIGNVYEEVALLFRQHHDLLEEFTYFLPDAQAPAQAHKRNLQRGYGRGMNQEMGIVRQMHKRKAGRRADDRDYDDEDDRRGAVRSNLAKELSFFEKVKTRLRNREQYQDFLKCLNLFAQEIVAKTELQIMVQDILSRYPDLMMSFNDFLHRCEMLDFDFDPKMVSQGRMHTRDIAKLKGDKYGSRPVSELDVSGWERCTTSYVKLPPDYPKLQCSHRTPLASALVNDIWVSVTSGSEDYSFKHMRKNQYEEALFRCEDDRYELDMVIESNASAIRAITPLVQQLGEMSPEDKANWRLPPNALSPIHFRSIQRLYDQQGPTVVDLLKKNPAVGLGVVLPRLLQKDEEWRKTKASMAKVWQKIYEANYHKSLDHRSFYFKQTDKKYLGAKAMLQEIKDLVERRRAADNSLSAVSSSAPFATRLHPDLVYKYRDRKVHEDAYKIIKYALDEILSVELAERAFDFWTTFVEALFGLPSRSKQEGNAIIAGRSQQADSLRPLNRKPSMRMAALSAEAGNDSEAEAQSALGGGDEADDVTTEMGGNMRGGRGRTEEPSTADAAGGKGGAGTGDEAEGPQRSIAANMLLAATVGDSEEAGPANGLSQPTATPMVSGEADAGSDGGTEEAERERVFVGCKPLAPAEATRAAEAAEAGDAQRIGRIFYGNDTFYIFFRLHQLLYDRLRRAVRCAACIDQPVSFNPDLAADMPLPELDEKGQKAHAQFMTYVFDLIDGTRDSSQYEDDVRALLGTNSYVLFTLDKLIYKLVKQFQAILADELGQKLLDLYKYESTRDPAHFSDAVYNANAHVLLHDDSCFRFESREADGTLTIQLLDPDRTEVTAGVLEAGFAEYLKGFTDSPTPAELLDREGVPRRQPFLKRSLPAEAQDDVDEAPGTTGDDSETVNGLECKLSTQTSKVSYVLDTEDVFRRIRKGEEVSPGHNAEARAKKFESWLDSRQQQILQQQAAMQQQLQQQRNAMAPILEATAA